MKFHTTKWLGGTLMLLGVAACQHPAQLPSNLEELTGPGTACDPDILYFEKDVLPLLLTSCAYSGCHDAATAEEDIIYDNYANTIRTGYVVPGNPNRSEMYQVLIDNGEDIMPPPPEAPLSAEQIQVIYDWIAQGALDLTCDYCDSAQYDFGATIMPLVETYCTRCHSGADPDGGVLLSSYAEVKASVENGSFWGTIAAEPGYSLMPPGAALPNCETAQIRQWLEGGALEN